MRGIPRKKDAADAPGPRDCGVKDIRDGALDPGIVLGQPGAQQAPDTFSGGQMGDVVTRHDHELPAPSSPDAPHEGRRTRGVAILDSTVGQPLDIPIHQQIDDDPLFMATQILEFASHHAPNGRSCAVTADEIPAVDCLRSLRVASGNLGDHTVPGLL